MDVCLRVLRKGTKEFLTVTVPGTVYWSYLILPFGIVACTFLPTTCLEIAVNVWLGSLLWQLYVSGYCWTAIATEIFVSLVWHVPSPHPLIPSPSTKIEYNQEWPGGRSTRSHQCHRIQILALTPYVGWVCCWFSPLIWKVFLRVLRFSPLHKNQLFQISIRSGTHGHVSTSYYELLSVPWAKQITMTMTITN